MTRLCSDSSCSYLGRSARHAMRMHSAGASNGVCDRAEVSRRHSTAAHQDDGLAGRPERQMRSETIVSLGRPRS